MKNFFVTISLNNVAGGLEKILLIFVIIYQIMVIK